MLSSVQRDDCGRIVGIDRCAFVVQRLDCKFFRLPYGSPSEIFTIYEIYAP